MELPSSRKYRRRREGGVAEDGEGLVFGESAAEPRVALLTRPANFSQIGTPTSRRGDRDHVQGFLKTDVVQLLVTPRCSPQGQTGTRGKGGFGYLQGSLINSLNTSCLSAFVRS